MKEEEVTEKRIAKMKAKNINVSCKRMFNGQKKSGIKRLSIALLIAILRSILIVVPCTTSGVGGDITVLTVTYDANVAESGSVLCPFGKHAWNIR